MSASPGAPAFVEVGQSISAGTEVCLIEVMKLFTSVRTEAGGIVRHIAAEDAQLVEGDIHEVELKIVASAKTSEGTAYAVDLSYAGLIGMRGLDENTAHAFLFAEAPRILFPFARRIIADSVRDAGFTPLMLDPIDFNGLYMQQLAAAAEQQDQAGGAPAGNA